MMKMGHEDGDADDAGMMLLTDEQMMFKARSQWIAQPHHLANKK